MKKSLSLLVAIAMVFSMFASMVSAAEEKSAGEKLKDAGVITGTSEGLQEGAEWRRADVAILISRLYGQEAAAKATTPNHGFTDLTDKNYGAYVTWAKIEGLFLGKSETTFGPLDSITNGQFATVILRALGQDQLDEAKNLAKAIELGLLPEGTVQTEVAKRGATYSAIVVALDVEVDGKKLGTKLGLKGYEVVDLKVESASALVSKEFVVNFNSELKDVKANDVSVKDADGNGVLVSAVKLDGKTATVSLAGALASGKTYTVTIVKAEGTSAAALSNGTATFSYTKGVPAKVEFASQTVVTEKTVAHVVKDADGNVITGDYPLSTFDVVTSDVSVIDNELKAQTEGFSVVNLTLSDNETVTTGNVTIVSKVVTSINIKEFKVNDKNVVYLEGTKKAASTYNAVDQSGRGLSSDKEVKYASSNPGVAVIKEDGEVEFIQAGKTTLTVTVADKGVSASKTLDLDVRAERKANAFEIDKSNVSVVDNTYRDVLGQTIKVTVKDQYGDKLSAKVSAKILDVNTVEFAPTHSITASGVTSGKTWNTVEVTDGEVKYDVIAVQGGKGNTRLQVTVEGINGTKTVTLNNVNAATAAGYEVVSSSNVLDTNDSGSSDSQKGSKTATITVYAKDNNGNRIGVFSTADFTSGVVVLTATEGKDNVVTVAGNVVTGTDNAIGNAKVTVKVNNVLVSTQSYTAEPSSPNFVRNVTQVKSNITVSTSANLVNELFGSDGVFKTTNKYGDTKNLAAADVVTSNVLIVSNNNEVVNGANLLSAVNSTLADQSYTALKDGQAILTVVINGNVYTLAVNAE